MEWYAYITDDRLMLTLESGASRSDSAGIAPALTGCDWKIHQGDRRLILKLIREDIADIEPGHHIELEIEATNAGKRTECGLFQMVLPQGVIITNPATNVERAFSWSLAPNETIRQPVVVQVEPQFDVAALWYLNYASIPVSVEAFWEGHSALLNTSLPMATPQ